MKPHTTTVSYRMLKNGEQSGEITIKHQIYYEEQLENKVALFRDQQTGAGGSPPQEEEADRSDLTRVAPGN
jgi:hypothetical protein